MVKRKEAHQQDVGMERDKRRQGTMTRHKTVWEHGNVHSHKGRQKEGSRSLTASVGGDWYLSERVKGLIDAGLN